jgi:subtilisin family serine protease
VRDRQPILITNSSAILGIRILMLLIAGLQVLSSIPQVRHAPNSTARGVQADRVGDRSPDPLAPQVPGAVLVGLKEGATVNIEGRDLNIAYSGLSTTLANLGIRATEPVFLNGAQAEASTEGAIDAGRVYRLHLGPDADIARIVQDLAAQPGIVYAEPDSLMHSSATPDDALYEGQWGLAQIDALAAWDIVTGTADVVIAEVGSGLDTSHPDLASQLWVNPGEIEGNGLDDDGNGYVDDLHGWNVLDDNADLSDNTGHSTMVAGIIVAAPNNEEGVVGVCWGCRLMVVKVTQPDGLARYADIAEGVAYAAQNGADVINISLRGQRDSPTLRSAIVAASRTAVVVSSAGNDGHDDPVYPAAYDTTLAVTGTNSDDAKPDAANHGTWVDVSAPGQDILTTSDGGGYQSQSGTSLATPFVSGLAGLLRSQHPEWSPDVVREQIVRTADDIDGLNPGLEGQLGSGRINAARAVTAAERPLPGGEGDAMGVQPGASQSQAVRSGWRSCCTAIERQ